MPALSMLMLKMTELQLSFDDPTNDWAALDEIADVIRKALRDPEFIRLANEPDTDKAPGWKVRTRPKAPTCGVSPRKRLTRCSTKIRSIEGNIVIMDIFAAGHSDDRAILVASRPEHGTDPHRSGAHDYRATPRLGAQVQAGW
jgi:hypothetical protein